MNLDHGETIIDKKLVKKKKKKQKVVLVRRKSQHAGTLLHELIHHTVKLIFESLHIHTEI